MRVNNIILPTVRASHPGFMTQVLKTKPRSPVPVNDQLALVERAADRYGWDWQRATRLQLERILP